MPELPEVETIKNNLKSLVGGLTITKVDVLRTTTILGNPKEFITTIQGKTIKDITRIGKFMVFHLTDDVCFISHLRMEGKYYKLNESERDSYYSRVVFHLSDNTKLCYDDSRCFGIMKLTNEENWQKEKEIAKLGPEPFAVDDPNYLLNKAKNKNIPVKTFLLDQSIMTGLGNIYVDETLFACGIHPLTTPSSLNYEDWANIIKESQRILKKAIESGGSTIRSYHPGKGIDGNFQVNLKAYGKAGEECPNCGHLFRKIRVGGRGTTFCPKCQKYTGKEIKVAICGPIGSGKSTVLNIFKENGFDTVSADEIVDKLYKDENVARQIGAAFSLNFENGCVDKNMLRNYLVRNINDKKRLERMIHPLVGKCLVNFMNKSLSKIKVCEVPLLYEAKMETLFDYVIVVTSSKAEQFLKDRDSKTANALALINANNKYEEYKKEADIVIYNDADIASLKSQINELIDKDLLMRLTNQK